MMPAFISIQLAPGVEAPPPPPGPPPPWMVSRPAGLRAFLGTFRSSTLDLDRLRAFTLDVFDDRHHFDPPHRIEPELTARALRAHWARAAG
jgi:hypothetical protein